MSDTMRLVPRHQESETRSEKFGRLAEKHVQDLLDRLDRLVDLSSRKLRLQRARGLTTRARGFSPEFARVSRAVFHTCCIPGRGERHSEFPGELARLLTGR